jgi:hypothetical protein
MKLDNVSHNIFFILLKFDLAATYAILKILFGKFKPPVNNLIRRLIFHEKGKHTPFIGAYIEWSEFNNDLIFLRGSGKVKALNNQELLSAALLVEYLAKLNNGLNAHSQQFHFVTALKVFPCSRACNIVSILY